jgi:hypothetical protein
MTQVLHVTGCAHFLDSSIQLPQKFRSRKLPSLGLYVRKAGI